MKVSRDKSSTVLWFYESLNMKYSVVWKMVLQMWMFPHVMFSGYVCNRKTFLLLKTFHVYGILKFVDVLLSLGNLSCPLKNSNSIYMLSMLGSI